MIYDVHLLMYLKIIIKSLGNFLISSVMYCRLGSSYGVFNLKNSITCGPSMFYYDKFDISLSVDEPQLHCILQAKFHQQSLLK